MHDMLFDNQSDWGEDRNPKDKFVEYAKNLDLDEETFKKDLESQEIKDNVKDDTLSANSLGLNSTPTFFLNGEKVQPTSFQDFKEMVEKEIEDN
jgi:protein-disulfide isomerase